MPKLSKYYNIGNVVPVEHCIWLVLTCFQTINCKIFKESFVFVEIPKIRLMCNKYSENAKKSDIQYI